MAGAWVWLFEWALSFNRMCIAVRLALIWKTVILPRVFKPVEAFFHGIDTRIFFPPLKKQF